MPETKAQALARAAKIKFPKSTVIKSDSGKWFIAPQGIKSMAGKKAYANCRNKSADKAKCAQIAWSVEKKTR